jgi:hypothetical protein
VAGHVLKSPTHEKDASTKAIMVDMHGKILQKVGLHSLVCPKFFAQVCQFPSGLPNFSWYNILKWENRDLHSK